jgi:predicted Zn-dependent peptidase
VEELFMAEIDRLKREPVSDDELDKAKRQLEVGLLASGGTSHALASRIAQETVSFGRVRSLAERLQRVQAVSVEDVQRVANLYLVDAKRSVVHVVPPAEGS